jgi:DNA-binding NarL/FixJ family response regulator
VSIPLKIRILLADDHALVRRGLRMVLDSQPDLQVVAEAGDGAQAVDRALQPDVDLAILDVTMPRMTGLAATRELARRRPELRILIVSMHENEQFLYEALKAGASGYVLKSAADRDLVEACRAAMRGEPSESYSNQQIADALVISVKTVERHRANILEKLDMHDRVQLTRYAIRRGLIEA